MHVISIYTTYCVTACFHLLYDYFCMSLFFADSNEFKITTFCFVCNEIYIFLDPSRFIASTALALLLIILPTSFNKVNIYICVQA